MSVVEAGPQLGRMLDSSKIQEGLRELNPDLAFDVAVNRPGDWESVVQFPNAKALEAIRRQRLPVVYRNDYIVAMDRGMIPEYKQWAVREILVEVPWSEADQDGTSIQWETVPKEHEHYAELKRLAQSELDLGLSVLADGRVIRRRCMAYKKSRGQLLFLGWRHTFRRLLAANIPGVTATSVEQKFGIDLSNEKMIGTPEEITAELLEE